MLVIFFIVYIAFKSGLYSTYLIPNEEAYRGTPQHFGPLLTFINHNTLCIH